MDKEIFAIASFRSRQQVMNLLSALRRAGVPAEIVTTPRSVAMGCGLSVRFDPDDLEDVRDMSRFARSTNLIGFYRVTRDERGQTLCEPLT